MEENRPLIAWRNGVAVAVPKVGRKRPAPYDLVAIVASVGGLQAMESISRVFAMPRSAMATGSVDRVLPIEAIGPALVQLAKS